MRPLPTQSSLAPAGLVAFAVMAPLLAANATPPHAEPMGVAAGEPFAFYCVPWSPCRILVAEAPDGGARGYRLALDADLAGGFGVRVVGLANATEDLHGEDDAIDIGGHGFDRGDATFEAPLAYGALGKSWTFTFAPRSGEEGGWIRGTLEWLPAGTVDPWQIDLR